MKFFKKHKTLTLIVLMIIAVLLAALIFRDTVNFDETTAIYGNRLEGMDAVKITKEQKSKVQDALKDQATEVNVRVAGKLVNILIHTNGNIDLAGAKAMGPKALEAFTDEQKKFFDFQFLIDNSENQSQFPIIGYKQHSRDSINWTKDRQKAEG